MRVQRRIYWTLPVLAIVAAVLIAATLRHDPWRPDTILGWLGADIYYPRWILFLGDWMMMGLSLLADFCISLGCSIIALSFWLNRPHFVRLNHESMVLYAAVFLSLSVTHLIVMETMFSGVYLLDLMIRSAAASLCMVTAFFTARSLLWPHREE
jgi:hypothetical protein